MSTRAIAIDPRDDVAVVVEDVRAGDAIEVQSTAGAERVIARQDIPVGHKVAIRTVAAGRPITKYGEKIGRATQPIRIGDHVEHQVGEGDGPVNALDAALRKALLPYYPNIETMNLVDYKVRVINSRAGTAAKVRVVIESSDRHEHWGTIGVSENIIDASWQALVDAIEYKVFKDK